MITKGLVPSYHFIFNRQSLHPLQGYAQELGKSQVKSAAEHIDYGFCNLFQINLSNLFTLQVRPDMTLVGAVQNLPLNYVTVF